MEMEAPGGRGERPGRADPPWEYSLRKYLLLLATLVAAVTCSAGFNPPGGVWQDADPGDHIAGDPVIRDTDHPRYVAFFYLNATALACSLVVTVLVLILSILHDRDGPAGAAIPTKPLLVLRGVMVLDLLSLMGAYAAGTCRDTLMGVVYGVLAVLVVAYVVVHTLLAYRPSSSPSSGPRNTAAASAAALERLRKVLMLLATFAVSVTYLAGLSAPGGFWDHNEGVYRAGYAVLEGGPHRTRLKVFFVSNTIAFAASLAIITLLLDKKLRKSDKVRSGELYLLIFFMLVGLVVAYSAGSCRKIDTTIYVNVLIAVVLACVLLLAIIFHCCADAIDRLLQCISRIHRYVIGLLPRRTSSSAPSQEEQQHSEALEKTRSLVLLLATLAATITYQAGLSPPGGVWQDDDDATGHKAGDPVLLAMHRARYRAFYYCNSVAFVASLAAVVLVQRKGLLKHQALEVAMILDLLGLIGAYAVGSSRDVSTSVYAVAMAGAALVYVVIHVVFFTLDHDAAGGRAHNRASLELLEKRRKRLLLFAILLATITYQAGLTPPSGFRLQDDDAGQQGVPGHRAGDPVMLYNYPRRYAAFFYCNTASFMLSISLIILLVNPNLYRPAIRSYALSVCTAAGMFGLLGAFAAGSTQHLTTSVYIFVLAGFVLFSVAALVIETHRRKKWEQQQTNSSNTPVTAGEGAGGATGTAEEERIQEKKLHATRKYLMVLGILVASVTYQAGMQPPGGVWQTYLSNGGRRHDAGSSVMHDNRHPRYLTFFYSNSLSFVASVVIIVLLLPEKPPEREKKWWFKVMQTAIVLDLLALLVAYAAGSSRSWRSSVIVSALLVAVLAYFPIHVGLSRCCRSRRSRGQANGEHQPANNV